MGKRVGKTGNEAGAEAFRQVNPDVAAVFPITPQTELMHEFAHFVADGMVDTLLVCVESEHSAMSACVGGCAAGARVFTATSAAGFALMWEVIYIAAGLRLPVVMVNVNRALNAPINIHCDHSDTMGARDSGWIQLFSESAQEVYDNVIQAFRIAENKDILLPCMVTLDGFILSHVMETMEMEGDDVVKGFVGEFTPEHYLLNASEPITVGPLDLQDWLMEHKRQNVEATKHVLPAVREVGKEYGELTGRTYDALDLYMMDDAEVGIVVLGSTAGTAKAAARMMREKGVKAGVCKIRCFRPFPHEDIAKALSKLVACAVLDRSHAFGLGGGPVFHEVRSMAYEYGFKTAFKSYVYGIGGRDINTDQICAVYDELARTAGSGELEQVYGFINLRD